MIKKIFSGLALACLAPAVLSFAGCAVKAQTISTATDNSWETILSAHTLVVGVEENFAPFSFTDENGELTGFDIDTAQEVGKALGVSVEFKTISLSQAEQALNSGTIDCLWSDYNKTTQRSSSSNVSFSYMTSNQVFLCLADNVSQNLADLKDQRIGVKDGSGGQQAIESSTAFRDCLASIGTYTDYEEARKSLDNRKISAVIMDEVAAEYYLKNHPNTYKILGREEDSPAEVLETGDYCVEFRREDESLAVKVEQALNALAADGTLPTLSEKWFGSDLSTVESR